MLIIVHKSTLFKWRSLECISGAHCLVFSGAVCSVLGGAVSL
jgi:hypothetical protein